MKAKDICQKAADLVGGDRSVQHGAVRENLQNIADLWSAWLRHPITAEDVAAMMVLLKLARTKSGAVNHDDCVDAAGYAGLLGELKACQQLVPTDD